MPTKIEKDAVTGRMTTGHEWDGLRELNTPLPRWWLHVFYATIVFALVWVLLYPALPIPGATGFLGWTARGALPAEIERATAAQAPMLARLRAETPAAIAADPELRAFALAGGRAAFAANCVGCHGAGGGGAPGGIPNLADDEWIWGGGFDAIRHSIAHGIRNADDPDARNVPMPRFLADRLLTAAQVGDVTEFVLSLTGRAGDAAAAARGAPVFAENCASCHAENGRGKQEMGAPSLADAIWLYGGDRASIHQSIANGRAGVMPAWGNRLDPAVINMLTVFVHSLGGGE
jgi:cytochrome c oxidase cbb3-type subunit 3